MARSNINIKYTSRLLLACLCIVPISLNADQFETYSVINSNEVLSTEYLSSTYHRVESIDIENGYYQFTVESNIGTYFVDSLELLKKRVSEIIIVSQAIDQYERQNSEITGELRSQLSLTGDSAVDIITSPFETASNLAGQLTDNLGATFAGEDPYLKDNSNAYSIREPNDPTTATHKRNAAFQVGLDVYTYNSKAQSFLNAVANARAAGRVTAGVGLNNSLNNPLKKSRNDLEIAYLLKSKSLFELDQYCISELNNLGISQSLIKTFVEHPVLSPSNKVAMVFYLSKLNKVKRLDAFIKLVTTAENEVMSLMFQQLSKMLWHYHDSKENITFFNIYKNKPAVLTSSRKLVVFETKDLLIWSEENYKLYSALAEHSEKSGYQGFDLVSLGRITPLADSRLAGMNYSRYFRFLDSL